MLDAVNSNSEEIEKSTDDQKQTDSSTNIEAKEVEKTTENTSDETTAALEKVVSSIEDKVAADAEKVEEKEVVPTIDYASLSMEDIVKEIKNLVKNEKIQAIKTSVESLRKSFDTKFSELLASKKAAFLAEGGESIDFHFSSPVKVEFNEIINEYRTKRNKHYSEYCNASA